VAARVSVEVAIAQGWRGVLGDAGWVVGLERFGASAAYQRLYQEFRITSEAVVEAARTSIDQARPRGRAPRR
jgi:transketolase